MSLSGCRKEYTILFAAATCVAEMLGGGVISLPYVIYETYWVFGGLMIIFGTILTSYTAYLLSELYLDICASNNPNKQTMNPHTGLLASQKQQNNEHVQNLTPMDDQSGSDVDYKNFNSYTTYNTTTTNNNNNNDALAHTGLTPVFNTFRGERFGSIDSVIQEELNSPYIEIGKRVFPLFGEWFLTGCVGITLIFVDVVFLVLCGMNVQTLLNDDNFLNNKIMSTQTICIMFFAFLTLVFSYFWYKVHDYQWFVWLAVFSSFLAIIMAFPVVAEYAPSSDKVSQLSLSDITLSNVIQAFGTIMFAFGGHAGFPTYQKNMGVKYQKYFNYSIIITYAYIFVMMFSFSIVITLLYGGDLKDNVLENLPDNNVFSKIITILITFHMFSATSTLVPPVCAILSKLIVKTSICVNNRIRNNGTRPSRISRISFDQLEVDGENVEIVQWWTPILVQFIAACIAIALQDNFLTVMGILGNTTVTLCTFVMPCLLYLVHFKNRISMCSKIVCATGALAGVVIGIISVGSNINDLIK